MDLITRDNVDKVFEDSLSVDSDCGLRVLHVSTLVRESGMKAKKQLRLVSSTTGTNVKQLLVIPKPNAIEKLPGKDRKQVKYS